MPLLVCVAAVSLLFPWFLTALWTGNPAEPGLEKAGLFISPEKGWTLRCTAVEDFVYSQRYRDELPPGYDNCTTTSTTLSTSAGMFTLNFKNRIDLYGILGASRLQINQEAYSSRQYSWGVGGKIIIFKTNYFFLGADIKYFATDQSPLFFVSNGLPFNVTGDFEFNYHEIQGSAGLCYYTATIAPYLQATYLVSKIAPQPTTALARWPFNAQRVDIDCNSTVAHRRWGIAIGATILSGEKVTFAIESRMFNQNAINARLELRL